MKNTLLIYKRLEVGATQAELHLFHNCLKCCMYNATCGNICTSTWNKISDTWGFDIHIELDTIRSQKIEGRYRFLQKFPPMCTSSNPEKTFRICVKLLIFTTHKHNSGEKDSMKNLPESIKELPSSQSLKLLRNMQLRLLREVGAIQFPFSFVCWGNLIPTQRKH